MQGEDLSSLFFCRRYMLRFYDIDKNYIKYLQTIDPQVPNIHYETNNKFVCGIVLKVNGISYYAPISHMTTKQQTNMQIFDGDEPIATIRFSFMIPAYDEVLTLKKFADVAKEDPKYADLLGTEYRYCALHEKEIHDKALAVHKIGCNKNHRLNYTCCDFNKLESEYLKYDGNIHTSGMHIKNENQEKMVNVKS